MLQISSQGVMFHDEWPYVVHLLGHIYLYDLLTIRASETDGGTGAGAESQSQSNSSLLFARNQTYALLKQQMELAGQVLPHNVPLQLQLFPAGQSSCITDGFGGDWSMFDYLRQK
ncbi:hypothetical protein Hdeb2414_s0012g00376751 [Helianthus debilis subsp. tardiflorus]